MTKNNSDFLSSSAHVSPYGMVIRHWWSTHDVSP